MDPTAAPLRTRADLERALAEARGLLERLDKASPAETARFDALLQRIAAWRGDDQPSDPERARVTSLEGHLQDYGQRWGQKKEAAVPWSPLLGGAVGSRRTSR